MTPFMTPDRDIYFNRMSAIFSHRDTATVSFGIYDRHGKVIAQSKPIVLSDEPDWVSTPKEVDREGLLAASSLYYTGWAFWEGMSNDGVRVPNAPVPFLKNMGFIPSVAEGGIIPDTFYPAEIQPGDMAFLSVTLSLVGAAPIPTPIPIQVITPNGSEVFMAADFMHIFWRTDVPTAGTGVKFELHNAQGRVAELGYGWNPAGEDVNRVYLPLVPAGNDYRVRVISTWNEQLFDDSDIPFKISDQPVLLIEPNGGEVWPVASRQIVHWKTNTLIAGTGVSLELWDDISMLELLSLDWDPDGESFREIDVPLVKPGTNYKVRVTSTWDPKLWDDSDRFISIVDWLKEPIPEPDPQGHTPAAPEAWVIYE